jgi:SAM-dependent methyltransferase
MVAFVSTRTTQFSYFDQVLDHPAWQGKKILDFGGNVGGFLVNAGDRVDRGDYWCLDLSRHAIEEGQRNFPEAHFRHYDRYSSQYNPNGVRNLPIPDLKLTFDFILAFSVFTHTHKNEMLELVEQLRKMLAPEGVFGFTFCDQRYDRSLSNPQLPPGSDVRKMLSWQEAGNPALDIDSIVETARQSDWCLLVDDKLHVEPGDQFSSQEYNGKPWESYNSYFTVDYMRSLFPDGEIFPPVKPEWQHCCVLRNG